MTDRFKLALRNSRRQIRDNLTLEYQHLSSTKICARIRGLEKYRQAKHIALYQAINGEVNLAALWNSAPLQGKFCYFPVLKDDKTLAFLPATPTTKFKSNRYGINEPDIPLSEAIAPNLLDLIFLPLIAFDDYGTRIGMGAGYYDRSLAGVKNPMLIGVAYDFQYYPYIQPQSWDVSMAAVVTQRKTYWSKR